MAMPSMMATHWVGQNSGPVFAIYGLNMSGYVSIVLCNAVF